MSIVYFDTSALVKLVVEEPGTASAASAWVDADVIAASALVYPEARAAIASAVRRGALARAAAAAAIDVLHGLLNYVASVTPVPRIMWTAGELAEVHALRGYDAVHLASALELGIGTLFVSADKQLAGAAKDEGMDVLVPR